MKHASTFIVFLLAAALCPPTRADAPPQLPGTQPLTLEGDIASQMIDGIDRFLLRKLDESVAKREQHWHRDFSSPEAYAKSIEPNRKRLAKMLGVVDERVPFDAPELVATTDRPALVGKGEGFNVYAIRWPVLAYPGFAVGAGDPQKDPANVAMHGEGLLLVPTKGEPIADVIAIPDCEQTPEQIVGLAEGVPPECRFACRLAEAGCRVVVPVLINRSEAFPRLTWREYLYRSAFELGRHLIGYEVQKVLACVDWFEKDRKNAKPQAASGRRKIGVMGYGEGGMIALFAGALDTRIDAVAVSGYFSSNRGMPWAPIDRNVFGYLREFGDAEVASMIPPRYLSVETAEAPQALLPGGRGAPAQLDAPSFDRADAELARTKQLFGDESWQALISHGFARVEEEGRPVGFGYNVDVFAGHLFDVRKTTRRLPDEAHKVQLAHNALNAAARHARQAHEIDRFNQALLEESQVTRQKFMQKLYDAVPKGLDEYEKVVQEYHRIFRDDVIGAFDDKRLPFRASTRLDAETDKWTRYEVELDVFADVFAYGLLIVPKGIKDGERRPVVVCQHGLEGRPQSVIGDEQKQYYKAFATELAEEGFVTFAPQNIYIFKDRFRTLQRKANPLGKTLFSIMVPQHQQITDWLKTLPFVDGSRIAFYGLSYGGKSAMRIPPLVDNYCLSICSADFNEWVWKNASTSTFAQRYTYANKGEYEIFEWDLGSTFNYAEMAALIAPRPFMVERGHDDGVAPDEMVAYEYAKIRRLYDKLGIGDRTEIEFFNGPHSIHGVGTYDFLRRHLNWPKPEGR